MTPANVFALIVWSNAPGKDEIVDDLTRRFTLLDSLQVEWSQEHWVSNLARLYGDRLPSAAEKAERCGMEPFLLAVVADPTPSYRRRRTRRGFERVNRNLFDARERYRRLTRGHDLVHATLDEHESAKDLFLISGRERDDFLAGSGETRRLATDLLGTDGWRDVRQLVRALELTGGCSLVHDSDAGLTLAVGDPWWAARIVFLSDDPPVSGVVRIGAAERDVSLVPAEPERRRFSFFRRG
jgi:hypothetical protein